MVRFFASHNYITPHSVVQAIRLTVS